MCLRLEQLSVIYGIVLDGDSDFDIQDTSPGTVAYLSLSQREKTGQM